MATEDMDHSFTDSVSYYSDDEDSQPMQSVLEDMRRFQFSGIERVNSDCTDDSWEVESYAVDSMELAKLRLPHIDFGDTTMVSSLGQNSAGRYAQDEEDWTVQSDCNDSIGLAHTRIEHEHELQSQVRPALPRITRRRASLGAIVKEEQGLAQGGPRRVTGRRMSMSSVHTIEESLSSHGSGNSDDAASKRPAVVRHKSMPYVKSAAFAKAVPLWPGESQEAPREKMERRVSNGGTPCAA